MTDGNAPSIHKSVGAAQAAPGEALRSGGRRRGEDVHGRETRDPASRASARRRSVRDGGAYEKIAGAIHFAIDPAVGVHERIADVQQAPRNAQGLVESWGDFYLLRPVNGGARRLLLDVPNRGRKIALAMFNSVARTNDPTTADEFGNGFLLRHGYTVAWVGWQHDVPRQDGLMALTVPRVSGVSGRVRCEFRPNSPVESRLLADRYHVPQPVARLDDPEAELRA